MWRNAMAEFKKVATVGDIQPGTAKLVEVAGKKIALFNLGGTIYGLDDVCPHRGGPLSEGPIEGESVTCPWHGSVFNIRSGAVETPPARVGVTTYKIRVQGTDVEVEI
jgi:nitrite reductase/ring-hydroxylating ferredoxin subunit